MRVLRSAFVLALVGVLAGPAAAQVKRQDKAQAPLVLKSQGSFFVGGESKTITTAGPGAGASGEVTVNQMYVQYQIPPAAIATSPSSWCTAAASAARPGKPPQTDGSGWSEYFVRKNRSVYLADQVSRARSGFDAAVFADVKAGRVPPAQLPNILNATHQVAWTVFRFGPSYGKTFPDGQFPVEAIDELYKQMIPDLNAILPTPNPTWTNMAALAVRLRGAVLMGHSESGFFPEQAALIDSSGARGLVSIEMPCPTLTPAQIATIAKIPTLVMFGDHLGDVSGGPANWAASFDSCNAFVEAGQQGGRRRADDAPAGAGHSRQQPHADAGQKQRSTRRPRDCLDRQARRNEERAGNPVVNEIRRSQSQNGTQGPLTIPAGIHRVLEIQS